VLQETAASNDLGYSLVMNDGQEDKRSSLRRRVLKGGIIAYNDRHVTVSCTVRDISDTGARLRLTGSVNAPDTFELIIDLDGFEANCEVVRRSGNEIGVRFASAPRIVPPKRSQIITPLAPAQAPSLRKRPKPGV
jgi:hypothetical protein